jgi:hypothetical protein
MLYRRLPLVIVHRRSIIHDEPLFSHASRWRILLTGLRAITACRMGTAPLTARLKVGVTWAVRQNPIVQGDVAEAESTKRFLVL